MNGNHLNQKTFPYKKAFIFIGMNIISWSLMFFIPGQHALMFIVLLFALTGWGMGVVPQPIVSLATLIYIALLGLSPFSESLMGYGQPFVWLLVSTFVLAAAFESTGLGSRIALVLLQRVKGNVRLSVFFVLMTLVILSFLIPTAVGRTALILPVCIGLIQVIEREQKADYLAKNLLLGVAFTSSFMSWAIITGSSSSIYAVSMIELMTDFEWTYFHWFLAHFPLSILLVIILWLVLHGMFPTKDAAGAEGREYIDAQLRSLGKMNTSEWKILFVGLLTLLGWMTEQYHGFSVPMIAMIAAVISCVPLIGVQTWKNAAEHIEWDVIILFGAAYTLADVLQKNGSAAWLAAQIGQMLPDVPPLGAGLLMIGFVTLFRLGFANMLGITAVVLPITISLSQVWEVNPVWLAQLVIIACSFCYFLPVQSPSNLITFASGYYTEKDLLKTGVVMITIVIPATLLFSFLYWPLIGLNPVDQ